jgi:site-specific DNA recombinase
MTKLLPMAAIYSRVSLEEQTNNFSLPSQQRECERLAASKGFATSKTLTFVDPGFSGAELDRPALSRLREAVRDGLAQAVVCHDPDRLSRKLAHLLLLTEEFEKAGVPLLFVNGAVDGTPEGKMFLSLRGAFAEFERLKLAERISRGRRQKAIEGYFVGGRAPFGYRYEGRKQGKRGELVVDPEQANIVRRIFAEAAQGRTLLAIARRLDEDEVPTVTGAKWSKDVVGGILRNSAYHGQAHYNRSTGCEPTTRRKVAEAGRSKKTSKRRRPESEWIKVNVPVIVDRALFDRARAAIEQTAKRNVGRPSARVNLLRGMIKCAVCGFSCVSFLSHSKARYRCNNFDRLTAKRRCRARSVSVAWVEEAVWAEVERMLSNPKAWILAAAAHDGQRLQAAKESAKRRGALEREIFRLRQREQRAAKSMLDSELEGVHSTFRADLKATTAKQGDDGEAHRTRARA